MDKVEIFNEHLRVSVNLHGAELSSLKSSSGLEYMWQADPDVWGRHAPVLFPIVGALKDNAYRYQNQSYSLRQHGFARDSQFKVVTQAEDRCVFKLEASEQTLKVYPFYFELLITYQLINNGVTITYEVANHDKQPLPFSIGGHPAFNLALLPNDAIDDYVIEFSEPETAGLYLLDNGLLPEHPSLVMDQQSILPLSPQRFDQDALIFLDRKSSQITLVHQQRGKVLTVACEGFPHLGLWSKPGAAFVCIEPWQGHADVKGHDGQLLNKAGGVVLAPTERYSASYTIIID